MMTEKREMELAGLMQEMIALGWTLETFDEDFDNFESDEVSADEKETCRRIFSQLWEERSVPMIRLQFTSTPDGNCLADPDGLITATCPVPEGASEDYGYLTLKRSIMSEWEKLGKDTNVLSFWYDGQEQYLAADADADADVDVDVEVEIDEEV